jgi:type I restriction enzyme, S subunit
MSDKLPINWNIYSFREIAEVVTGTTPSTNHAEYYGGSFPFVGPAELGENLITKSSKWLSEIGIMQARLLPAETILVCCIGATIGKVGFTGIELATNQQINALICNREIAFPRYVFHYCKTLKSIIRNQGASTTLPLLPKGRFQELKISLPPIDQQKRIAAILDKAEELRILRRQSIEQLDILGRSIFMEMFGDPVKNPKGIKVVNLSEITTRITDGVHQKPNYIESGIPFISVKNITTGSLKFEDCKFISLDDHLKFTKRCRAEYLDILYTKVGATYGRPAIVDVDYEFSLYVSVCLIKPDKKIVDPFFLNAALGTTAVKNQADRRIKGIGVPDLHLDQIQKFLIPLPSMEEQQEFARRIQAIEHLKSQHRESLAQLDKLFASLQHRAFRGEL